MRVKPLKILVLLTLLSGTALFLISNLANYSDEKIVDQIETNLQNEKRSFQKYVQNIELQVEKGDFDLAKHRYSSYLFLGTKLISWNSNEFDVKKLLSRPDGLTGLFRVRNSLLAYQNSSVSVDSTTYTLISFFPIKVDYSFNNQYLISKPNPIIVPLGVILPKGTGQSSNLKVNFDNDVSFEIVSPSQKIYSSSVQYTIQILTMFFTLGLFLSVFLVAMKLAKSNRQLLGLLLLMSIILLSRSIMIMYNYPNAYLNIDLFRSRIFVSSAVNSSLGDLFLNNASILIMIIYGIINRTWLHDIFKTKLSLPAKKIIGTLMIVFSFGLLGWFFQLVFGLLTNAQIALDVYTNIGFSWLSITSYLSVLTCGVSCFFLNDLIYKILIEEIPDKKFGLRMFLSSIVFFLVLSVFILPYLTYIALLQGFYIFLIYYNELPIRLSKLKFGTFIYGLTAIFLLSITATLAVYKSYEFKERIKKEKLATRLLIERDIEGEYLLKELVEEIKSDVLINGLLVNPQSPKKQITDRITRYFNHGYFDNYNVKIALFDKMGNPLDNNMIGQKFSAIKEELGKEQFKTDFNDIYFQSDDSPTGRNRYMCFLNIERYQNHTGSIVIDLRLKKQVSKSVYPELLLEHRFSGKNDFDYAIFNKENMVYKVGNFNYEIDFNPKWLLRDQLYKEGIESKEVHHLGVKGENKTIIISSNVYPYWAILSNFSFYFLLILMGGILISIVNALFTKNSEASVSFSTKILIYIGCAFAIPIAFVGFAIINTISTSYKSEIEKSYEKKTVAISESIVNLLESYLSNNENKESITNEISKIARSTRSDINVYNVEGKLITTSQPKVFELGLLTSSINPEAYDYIIQAKKDKIILDESIGNLTYKSSYIAIRGFEDGKLLGVMSSPFFGSKNHLNRQETEIFNNIINITTLIFIFSVWFTYIAVRRLTRPLIFIASKLKSTELKEENEPLHWETNDEIGVLVEEYNKMVEKLEVSKKELAKNEKEAAWREMAKQVAHEIKNPLTPMKLTLQHLDRVMDKTDARRKPLNTLLSQVDTLDEIVTSFSHFAKMPDPENINFNIKIELEKIIHLHPEKNIILSDNASDHMVNADKKLFGRIFNNIILNAFQAMSNIENSKLEIDLTNKKNKIQLSFKDNGIGISEDIKEKIFSPNFSTKDSGSGIGLAVAKRGIEHAGGTIHFESKATKGTTFFIELPTV